MDTHSACHSGVSYPDAVTLAYFYTRRLALGATPRPAVEGEYSVEILRVMDGDTLEVEIDEVQVAGLKNQTVRIFGIDTPETFGQPTISRKFVATQVEITRK